MGHVELDRNGAVVFVFPEHLDEQGEPQRVTFGEAAETDVLIESDRRLEGLRSTRRMEPSV